MTNKHFMRLSEKAIKSLKQVATIKRYSKNTELHYQGQNPIVAYLILKGSILLLKNSETYHKLTKGFIVGYRELSLNTPSIFTAKVLSNTEICYIDRSTLLEIKNSSNDDIHNLYLELKNAIE